MEEKHKKIVIIGGALSGFNVALNLAEDKKITDAYDIVILKKEAHPTYSPCGMPYVFEGTLSCMTDLLLTAMEERRKEVIKTRPSTEVTRIDAEHKTLELNGAETMSYDILILATGREPALPPVDGIALDGVATLSTYEDGVALERRIANVKNAVIIGAGPIGLEFAVGCASRGITTTIVEALSHVVPRALDADMAAPAEARLKEKSIRLMTSARVERINGDTTVASVTVNGEDIPADLVLAATGMRPNTTIGKNAGFDVGETGAFIVNEYHQLRFNGVFLDGVYALGDCVETTHPITKKAYISALASSAVLQARIISETIAGRPLAETDYLAPMLTSVAGLHIGAVGVTEAHVTKYKISARTAKTEGLTKARFFPDHKNIIVKLIASGERLIGAQFVGEGAVKEYVDIATMLIKNRISLDEALTTERCYTPPLTLLVDPFVKALAQLRAQQNEVSQ